VNILMLVGSLRADSWTGHLVGAVSGLLPEGAESEVYAGLGRGLGDLPHYDQDLDTDQAPAAVVTFREAVAAADALVVATPEYNGSVPGVLKNAIDWASRPRGASAIDGKPVAVVSVSPSPRGAQWAREDAVKILRVAGAQPLEQSIGVASVHDTVVDGEIADPGVRRALTELMTALVSAELVRAA
jgi:chromate reductase